MNPNITQTILKLHREIRQNCHHLTRMSIALYDETTGMLSNFTDSDAYESPLTGYQARLEDVPSLQAIVASNQPRVLQDIAKPQPPGCLSSPPTRALIAAGYRSSYTLPLRYNQAFLGFLFFDSDEKNYFSDEVTTHLQTYAQLITALIFSQLFAIKTLDGALRTARTCSHRRDEEPPDHLTRMAQYTRLIAAGVAKKNRLSDEQVEYIYQYAQLHDIGKVAIPDSILLKPARLCDEELYIVQGHVRKGVEITTTLIGQFALGNLHHIDILKNIIAHHHERQDGSGYPQGLKANQIPIEARIVAVADVFDALTHRRPYKSSWSVDDAFRYLLSESGSLFDRQCVQAAVAQREQFQAIHQRYPGQWHTEH